VGAGSREFPGLESRTVHPEEISSHASAAPDNARSADALLVEQVRRGDPEAGHRFFAEHYPGVYRYLLWLTGRPPLAEDLAQETFVRAWRYLHTFDGRAPLGPWLHRIAHREFLRALRSQTAATRAFGAGTPSLDEVADVAEPRTAELTEAAELRAVIRKLPVEEGEVLLLHYLQGYSCQEIARIVRAPVTTVKYRLLTARSHLQRELGEGDLVYLNEPGMIMRQWAWLPLDQMYALEARFSLGGAGTQAPGAGKRAAEGHGASQEEAMERREFLRHAAVGAVGLVLSDSEKAVVDGRLTQKTTLAFKGTALADVCEHLRSETGVLLAAGPSVADEKVTLFCEKLPLRDVMRQLSRPFGYTWLRSGKAGEYHYELVQDLRSQLLEEELRNRDRNAALLALEKEIERFRPYLSLSPDEALAQAKIAPEAEKRLLETLAGEGWGPIQMYFRLSPQQQAALRAGQTLTFSEEPGPGAPLAGRAGQYPLPKDMARGVLQSIRKWGVAKSDDGGIYASVAGEDPKSVPLTALPEVGAKMYLTLSQSELGQFELGGAPGFFAGTSALFTGGGPYAVGRGGNRSEGGLANPKVARDPALRQKVSLQPQPSCNLPSSLSPGSERVPEERGKVPEPKVTTADALEALHHATRLPIIADFYTRLYTPEILTVKNQPLSEALNQLTEAMRLRWNREGEWLQFRSATYYHDRLKEVPNRHLSRWATARRQQGMLTLDQVVEIAQLTDDQLDAAEMAEGASECWGLQEWRLLRDGTLRSHVRYLGEFSPAQRQEMTSAAGLSFTRMSLTQQQGFITRAFQFDNNPPRSLEELSGATLRVDYTQPGWYQWLKPGSFSARRWVVSLEPGPAGQRVVMPPVRERTRVAALQTARRVFPPVTDENPMPQADQIAPTELDLVIVYIQCTSNAHPILWIRVGQQLTGL
jgi:RNA polymerase sigma factor (sigma-70 family)